MTNNNNLDIIRPKDTKKSDPFVFCRWAAGEWEARHYANTPAHLESREATIKKLNSVAHMKGGIGKVDAKQAIKNNKAKGGKR